MNQVLIFSHIPKTAGTSLRYHFQKHLKDQTEFIHLANKGHKIAHQQGLLPFSERSDEQRNRAQVILGHDVNINTAALVSGKKAFQLVYFRDPVAWEISRYNQYANARRFKEIQLLPYRDWVNLENVHSQFDWFLQNYCLLAEIPSDDDKFELILQYLNQMQHVGFVDQINQDMEPFFEELEIPIEMKAENVTGRFKKADIFNEDSSNKTKIVDNCFTESQFFLKIRKKYDRKVK